MTESEVKTIAESAAEGALQKFMVVLGVDISTPAATIELQKDFAHVRTERLTVGKVRDKILATITGSAVTGLVGVVAFYLTRGGH